MRSDKNVVVIGGGLGGLSAAISLAQQGYKVALYEKNSHLGGKLNRLEQDGFGFDLGPSILTMPHIFERLFTESGRRMSDYVPLVRLEHQWRSFFPDGHVIDLYQHLQKMKEHNPSLKKRDIRQYQKLLNYSKKLYETTEQGYFKQGFDRTKDVLQFHGVLRSIKNFDLTSTMFQGIDKRISNPQFRDMLSYFVKYVGSSPYDAPAILNMLIYMQHAQGVWYVLGGMHHLAEGLVNLAEELGVECHTGQRVCQLEKKKGTITGALLEDGTRLTADYYVSNMEVIPAYEQLLQEKKPAKKLKKTFEPSSSGLVLHLGVSKRYPQLHHHNFFFSKNMKKQMNSIFHRHELPDDPVIYLVNVTKTDPAQAPEGYENLKILPHIPYKQTKPFSEQDYAAFANRVLIKLEKMGLTDLRQNIVTQDMWTPEDIERVYLSDRGSIYGTLSDRKQNSGFKHPKQSERYDNLYFVGGTVNPGGGMPMVTLSGQQVKDMIVKRDQNHDAS
ncbi:NAD(P)/FAD-dependent oxidoreductase [Barrientosiimonas marina]|uniref:4,4'-diaponeurosporene oxygenase n=1 Tax=Lentibacillus kimchii TaxID=1542911 RepID=A0ABW2UTN3_9BACI